MQHSGRARLFVVATPIGNLEDLSPRARRVLAEADIVAAEDTRHSRKLLGAAGSRARTESYHEHNEAEKAARLIAAMQAGQSVALVTDAGTPCISDPGYRLVAAAREAGICVETVPGPCSPVAALSVSGLPSDRFAFHGFLPRKRAPRRALFAEWGQWRGAHVAFESPQRLAAALDDLAETLPSVEAAVARELTKLHEEVRRGTPAELAAHFRAHAPRGECVLLAHVADSPARTWTDDELREQVAARMQEEGLSRRDAVRAVADATGEPRNRVYAAAQEKEMHEF